MGFYFVRLDFYPKLLHAIELMNACFRIINKRQTYGTSYSPNTLKHPFESFILGNNYGSLLRTEYKILNQTWRPQII